MPSPATSLALGLIDSGWSVSEACSTVVAAERVQVPGEALCVALCRVCDSRAGFHGELVELYRGAVPLELAA